MQRAKGGDMILNFREMAGVSLRSGMQPKWTFRGQPVGLLPKIVLGTVRWMSCCCRSPRSMGRVTPPGWRWNVSHR